MFVARLAFNMASMAVKKKVQGTRERTIFVAQQLTFVNALAGNDKKIRYKALKKLSRYLAARSSGDFVFTEDDIMRIWKGLFYCMWMSDKPLIQEELCESISNLVHDFQSTEVCMLFIKGFFNTMIQEWFGIDIHRIDKFHMFIRRFARHCFLFCKHKKWESGVVKALADVFSATILSTSNKVVRDLGLIMHFTEIYLEELAKIGEEKLPEEAVMEFLKPFATNLCYQDDYRIRTSITNLIFYNLMRQSPQGIEYEAKYEAWLRAGCPGESYEDMEFVPDDDNEDDYQFEVVVEEEEEEEAGQEGEEEEEDHEVNNERPRRKTLDPRAGGVNVLLPQIHFDPDEIAHMLKECASVAARPKFKRGLRKLFRKFELMGQNVYPLACKASVTAEEVKKAGLHREDYISAINEALQRMEKVEKPKKRKSDFDESSKPVKEQKLDSDPDSSKKENLIKKKKGGKQASKEEKLEKYKIRKKQREEKREEKRKAQMNAEKEEQKHEEENMVNGGNEETVLENQNTSSGDQIRDSASVEVPESSCQAPCLDSSSPTLPEEASKTCDSEASDKTQVSTRSLRSKSIHKKENTPIDNEDANGLEAVEKRSPRRTLRVRDSKGYTLSTPKRTNAEEQQNLQNSSSKISEVKSKTSPEKNTCGTPGETKSKKSPEQKLLTKLSKFPTTPVRRSPRPKTRILKSTPSSGKRVNIDLLKNKFQGVPEYEESVRQSPTIPFDANKKPCQGVLKPSTFQSPINPFYRAPKGVRTVFS